MAKYKDFGKKKFTPETVDFGKSAPSTPASKPTSVVRTLSGNDVTVQHNPAEFLTKEELQRKNASKKSKSARSSAY